MRKALVTVAGHPRVKEVAVRLPVVRRTVNRFVPGPSVADAVRAVADLRTSGLLATVDHLGEDTTTQAAALAATEANLELIARLADAGLTDTAEISIKASAIGQFLPGGAALAEENAGRIVAAATAAGTTVTIDAEGHTTTDATHALVAGLREEFPATGLVLQAMLHRTPADAARWATPGSRVRLCKGAYAESSALAHTSALAVRQSFAQCLATLIAGGAHPMIATHDPALITAALGQLLVSGRGVEAYEFQMLHGVRPEEQRRLAAEGHRVRVYVPFGDDWYGYYVRRLAEKPANLALLGRALISRS